MCIRNKHIIPVLTLFMLLSSCGGNPCDEESYPDAQNIGHAGMGFNSLINPFNPDPDNSMAAIKEALALGADGVEVDVQLTADSVLVLYHDNKLDSKTDKKGCINELPAAEVIGLPFTTGFPFDMFHDEVIISLDSLFNMCNRLETFPWIYLDIHNYNYCDEANGYGNTGAFARALARSMRKYRVPYEKVIPTSMYLPMLWLLREESDSIRLYFEETGDYKTGLKIVQEHRFHGLVMKPEVMPGREEMEKIKAMGIVTVTFGGKAKSTLREMLQSGPDVMQVNNVKAMKEVLEEYEACK